MSQDESGGPGTTGRVSQAMPNELIVSLEYFPLVGKVLDEQLGINAAYPGGADISAELGLARLSLTPGSADCDFIDVAHPRGLVMDDVADALDLWFRENCERWVPPIAVNHVMDHVALVGEVTFGGNGEVLDAGEVTFGGGGDPVSNADPPWPPRSSGPGQGVRIGVADTLLAPQPWMAGGWAARYSDQEHDAEPFVTSGHATFVTGLVLSQAPGATVVVRRALDPHGVAKVWDVAKQIVAFSSAGIDVLNLSFACYTTDGRPPLALANAINRLDPDTVVVAAAGNLAQPQDGPTPPPWPAAFDRVVAVGAADINGTPAPFSPTAPWVDLLAPGVDVRSTFLSGKVTVVKEKGPTSSDRVRDFSGYARWSGTSFAAALVSGTIAAGVRPGRVTARQSLDDILDTLRSNQPGDPSPFLHVTLPG